MNTSLFFSSTIEISASAGSLAIGMSCVGVPTIVAQRLALPVVLVVGMKLGCINHALLTQAAIRGRGLVLAGWIANRIDPAMDSFDDNVESLRARLDAPLLATMAWAPDGDGELAIGLPGT